MSDTAAVSINADYGALLLGGMLAFGPSGCVNMQFIIYWQIHPDLERWTTKSLAVVIWLLDLCHSAFIAVAVWDSVIVNYGNLNVADNIPWSVGPTVELTAITTFLVQNFFAHRIHKLQKNKLTVANHKLTIASPVFVLAFLRLVAASVTMAEMIKLKRYSLFARPFPSWIFTLGLTLSALVDVIITISLCYFLRSNRSAMESSTANRIIDILTVWTVENGSATCLGAIATIVCWLVAPHNRIFLSLHFLVAKLYANSFFASLNARIKIHKSLSRDVRPNRLQPIALLHENTFEEGNEAYELRVPMSPQRHSIDQYALRPSHKKRSQSKLEVSVLQSVETKYDRRGGADVMTMNISELGRGGL